MSANRHSNATKVLFLSIVPKCSTHTHTHTLGRAGLRPKLQLEPKVHKVPNQSVGEGRSSVYCTHSFPPTESTVNYLCLAAMAHVP